MSDKYCISASDPEEFCCKLYELIGRNPELFVQALDAISYACYELSEAGRLKLENE